MKTIQFCLLATLFLAATSCKKQDDSKEVARVVNKATLDSADIKPDWKFAITAADEGMLAVALGDLAQQRSASPEVKSLGQLVMNDHKTTMDQLNDLALEKSIMLPDTMSDACQRRYDKLAEKTGAEFDKDYIKLVINNQESIVKAYEREKEKGNDEELKAWASGKISTMQQHIEKAKAIESQLK